MLLLTYVVFLSHSPPSSLRQGRLGEPRAPDTASLATQLAPGICFHLPNVGVVGGSA
ncbi:hypothetical protein I79_014610 [Cricetulus griseus]|uniref:Uncharacterized protein n=1 Tax=Cricetulus griseus TaxID=10029 RepID=G3HUJ8_CRIGR|nr:hypothetical protein I79_014610 [Cricetulus griseus]